MFSEKIHRFLFLFGILSLAFGMMIGTVPTSVPQIILFANWLLEADFLRKWKQLRGNTIFWALSSLFLIHLAGLIHTEDINAGLNDVRTKMPLMFLPMLLLTSRPLSRREFHGLMYCFLAGCFVNTLWCLIYSFIINTSGQLRNASRFMSHIRLGLYLNIAIAACVYFMTIVKPASRILFGILILYFISIFIILGLASGLVNFIILSLVGFYLVMTRQKTVVKFAFSLVLIALAVLITLYVRKVNEEQVILKAGPQNEIQERSSSGRGYLHFDIDGQKENGNYTLINIQPEELQNSWNHDFPQDTFSYSPAVNLGRFEVLVRYMASKGINKDSAGYASLTDEDKFNIRNDITNFQYPSWDLLRKRTYELVNEYNEFKNGKNVNGHSLSMRFYFWKASLHVIKNNPLTGVGTGDVQHALNNAYAETNSPLEVEWYKRPHNQFITVMVALGICGLLVFVFSLSYPIFRLFKKLHVLYLPFFILAIISFLMEDTLETQAGLTFYAFFNSIFIADAFYKGSQQVLPDN
jgi:hypothetical protein